MSEIYNERFVNVSDVTDFVNRPAQSILRLPASDDKNGFQINLPRNIQKGEGSVLSDERHPAWQPAKLSLFMILSTGFVYVFILCPC